MKSWKVLFITAATLVSVSWTGAVAQEHKITRKQVPPQVLSAFQKSYPHARIKGYASEKNNGVTCYEIQSVEGTTHRDILYTAEGNVVELEETITADQLPKAVSEAVEKGYHGKPIVRIEKSVRDGQTKYEVVIRDGKKEREVMYDENGQAIPQTGATVK